MCCDDIIALMMETEMIPETTVISNQLSRLIAGEDFSFVAVKTLDHTIDITLAN
jgi:hypothetical protein